MFVLQVDSGDPASAAVRTVFRTQEGVSSFACYQVPASALLPQVPASPIHQLLPLGCWNKPLLPWPPNSALAQSRPLPGLPHYPSPPPGNTLPIAQVEKVYSEVYSEVISPLSVEIENISVEIENISVDIENISARQLLGNIVTRIFSSSDEQTDTD